MDKSFYEALQNDFIMLRHQFSGSDCDIVLLDKSIAGVKKLILNQKRKKVKITGYLIYCIDRLFDVVDEGNREKTYDFADTIHNIPEICLGKRDFKSFKREIKAFRRKYGSGYLRSFLIW